jgi:hypothetical protein
VGKGQLLTHRKPQMSEIGCVATLTEGSEEPLGVWIAI